MHHRLEQAWELKTAGKNIWEFDPAYRAVQQAGRSPKVTTKDEKSSAVSTPHRVSNVPQQTRLPGDEVLKRALEKEKEAIQMARNATRRFNEGPRPHPAPPVRMVTNPWLKPPPTSHHSSVHSQGARPFGSHSSASRPSITPHTSGSHNSGNRPWVNRSPANHFWGGRPASNHPSGNHSSNSNPSGSYTSSNRPSCNPPASHHTPANRPSTNVSAGYRQWDNPPSGNNTSSNNRSGNGPSGNHPSSSGTPGNGKPGVAPGTRPPIGPKLGSHWQRGPHSGSQYSGSHQPNHRPAVSSPLTQQWKKEKDGGQRKKSKSPKKARQGEKPGKKKAVAQKSKGQKPEGQTVQSQTPAETQQPSGQPDLQQQNQTLRLSPEVKDEPGTERPSLTAPPFTTPDETTSQASSQPSSQASSQPWSNHPSEASSQTSAGTQTAETPPQRDQLPPATRPSKQTSLSRQPSTAEGPGANQDVVTVLESLMNKSFSELCTQMTENIRSHVTESFETKHRELTAQNQQLVEKLEQQTQLLDKQHAWLLTNHPHPRAPTVLASIETDDQSQQHWDAEEWRYINAPVLGHSDDSADETYAPTINFDLDGNGVENAKDGNVAADRDSDTEEKGGGSSSRRKGKGKEKMRERKTGKGKEKRKEKKKKKNGCVLPESTSKKRKRKGRDRAKHRRRVSEQEEESSESSEEKETPAKRRRTARGKETSSDSSENSDSSDSSESSAEETPVKGSRKARERDKGASSDRSKSRFKESPIVNPYLTKIAEEQARLERLKRMSGTSGGTGTIQGGYRHRCARGRFI